MRIDISNRIGTTSNFGGFRGLLDKFSGAAAAYSLRKLSKATTSVVRVRRSSDNAEADFTAQEIIDGTLQAWVNADIVKYTSDFTSTENLFESNGTGAAAQSVAGVNDAYKFTLSGGNTTHLCGIFSLQAGVAFTVEFDYYIPSGQTVDAIRFRNLIANTDFNTLDSWTSVSISTTSSLSNDAFWQPLASGNATVNADGDVFYLKNIVVTQTTADGLVTTWYDQSGNGNDATQGSAAAQPKIVSAGVLVTENGKPAVSFDGNNTMPNGVGTSTPTNVSAFAVRSISSYPSVYRTLFNYKEFGLTYNSNGGILYGNGAHIFKNPTPVSKSDDYPTTNGQAVDTIINNSNLERNAFAATLSSGGPYGIGISAIGSWNGTSQTFIGTIQELIIYESDESANKSGIKTNINNYYTIYP